MRWLLMLLACAIVGAVMVGTAALTAQRIVAEPGAAASTPAPAADPARERAELEASARLLAGIVRAGGRPALRDALGGGGAPGRVVARTLTGGGWELCQGALSGELWVCVAPGERTGSGGSLSRARAALG